MKKKKVIGIATLAMCLLHIAGFLYFLFFSNLFATTQLLIGLHSLFIIDVAIIFSIINIIFGKGRARLGNFSVKSRLLFSSFIFLTAIYAAYLFSSQTKSIMPIRFNADNVQTLSGKPNWPDNATFYYNERGIATPEPHRRKTPGPAKTAAPGNPPRSDFDIVQDNGIRITMSCGGIFGAEHCTQDLKDAFSKYWNDFYGQSFHLKFQPVFYHGQFVNLVTEIQSSEGKAINSAYFQRSYEQTITRTRHSYLFLCALFFSTCLMSAHSKNLWNSLGRQTQSGE
ncbi:hypothetical protein H9Q10_04085 [Eikenella sp. S3360]|uniref:Uncharacterized protein n=1 Tax=Eikenella glucosivorans TaxID=2766967 RepID=A0ABS0N977_9NEIS|nr:hypothetical protein [Eikenella glucosivorans]MBH5328845.1 hypothetical protein [Eikenella glucosivorans]